MYINKLDDIFNKSNNTYHNTIKMRSLDVKSSTHIDFNKSNYREDPKFEVGDQVRISKHKNILAKGYVPNWFVEVFMIPKAKSVVPWTYVISDFKGEDVVGSFYKKKIVKNKSERI